MGIPTLIGGLEEATNRFEEVEPDCKSVLNEARTARKDNIHAQVYWTTNPESE